MNVKVLKIYVLGLIDELNWMLWGLLLWVIDYLISWLCKIVMILNYELCKSWILS